MFGSTDVHKKMEKWVLDNYKNYGDDPFGHAYFWATVDGKKDCVGGVPGIADLNGMCRDLSAAFPQASLVWYNLD